ncbi:MAG: DNA primase, partial [Armatimonadota bacterium]
MQIEDILALLRNVKPARKPNQWTARCPAHDDKRNSLAVSVKNGAVLLHCFAGCSPFAVVHAIGLEPKHLFLDGNTRHAVPAPPRSPDPLGWFAAYCGVDAAFLQSLPVAHEDGWLAFTFEGLPVR